MTISLETVFLVLLIVVERTLVFYVIMVYVAQLVLLVLGCAFLRRERWLDPSRREALLRSPLLPKVSILSPAHNEAASIVAATRALLNLNYPHHEVIVINDGSKDDTLQILIDEFRLFRSHRVAAGRLATKPVRAIYESRDPIPLLVIDKENGGKADALNVGLEHARGALVAAVDADSLLEPDALLSAITPFLESPELTVAVGGMVRVVNGCELGAGRISAMAAPRTLIAIFQLVEYLRAFLGARIALSLTNSLLIISGAFGLFDREIVMAAGGFLTTTVGEDMELVVRLHEQLRAAKRPYRIAFAPEPVCWTEVPESWKVLQRQRNRWQRGAVESLWEHRKVLFNPRFGVVGMFAVPYFLFFEVLAPVAELLGYALSIIGLRLGRIQPEIAVAFFAVAIMFGIMMSVWAVLLEDFTNRRHMAPMDLLRFFGVAVIENLGIRQAVVCWRLKGLYDALKGKKGWGQMQRRGFGGPQKPTGQQTATAA